MQFMSNKLFLSSLLFSLIVLYACNDDELPVQRELDEVPQIQFFSLTKSTTDDGFASLLLTIDILDGDADIGVLTFRDDPLNPRFEYLLDNNGNRIRFGDSSDNPPFNCVDYSVEQDVNTFVTDTFLIRLNPLYNNLEVDFFLEDEQVPGQFELLDWRAVGNDFLCGENFYGRFQDPASSLTGTQFSFEQIGPNTTRLTYDMSSIAFPFVLTDRSFQLRCSVRDRALNQSNVIFTPEMVF